MHNSREMGFGYRFDLEWEYYPYLDKKFFACEIRGIVLFYEDCN